MEDFPTLLEFVTLLLLVHISQADWNLADLRSHGISLWFNPI